MAERRDGPTLRRLLGATVLLAALVAVAWMIAPTARAEPPRLASVTLYQGLNIVAWTGEPVSVDDFVRALPATPRTIFIRDPETRRYRFWRANASGSLNSLRAIPTGAVVNLRLSAPPPGPWVYEQADSLSPTEIGPELTPGSYQLVWHERGQTRLVDALRGLGDALERVRRWDAIAQRNVVAPPDALIRYGDVLTLEIGSPVYWARPTDEPTKIVWFGTVSAERRVQVRAAIDAARDWFADEYGVETVAFTLYYGDDIDAILRGHRQRESEHFYDGTEDGWRGQWASGGLVVQQYDHMVLGGEVWGGGDSQLRRAAVQQYWRILRARLAGHLRSVNAWHRGNGAVPSWMRAASYQRERFSGQSSDSRSRWIDNAAETDALLSAGERWDGWRGISWQVTESLSSLGVEWLADYAGDDSLLEFWRQLRQHDRWQDAFRAAFGLTSTDFYRRYESWRAAGFPIQAGGATHMISGRVQGPDREPVADFTLHACPEDSRSGDCVDATTDADGSYAFSLPAGRYMLSAVIEADGCTVSRNYGGRWRDLTQSWSSHSLIDIREGDMSGRALRLSALPGSDESAAWCERGRPDYFDVEFVSFSGNLTGPDGAIGGVHIHACLDPDYRGTPSGSCYAGVSAANGDFYINLPANATYQLSIEPTWSRCETHGWYANTGPTENRKRARTFTVRGADIDGLKLKLPANPAALSAYNPCN